MLWDCEGGGGGVVVVVMRNGTDREVTIGVMNTEEVMTTGCCCREEMGEVWQ